ncbi:Proteasome subunit beta type-10 [Myotis brandtii]|uniref:Proteasome subunit beta type-10 n=1 Tax=Myotis brandtii TaxID=109478 RepID=S7PT31_MYOBR|nr:Proteasome subunit beta type-10 [Myotis brandtii]
MGGAEEVVRGGGGAARSRDTGRGQPEELGKGRSAVSQRRPVTGRGGAPVRRSVVSGAWVPVLANDHAHSAPRYQGHIGASLVVGGVDVTGPQLYSVHPHGSYSRLPFTALGSGQDAALAMLEDRFQPNMTLEAAQGLLVEAITAGILGDLGSGGSVDACVITGTGAKMLRTLSSPTKPIERHTQYLFAPGTTAVLSETVKPLPLELVEETVQTMEVE